MLRGARGAEKISIINNFSMGLITKIRELNGMKPQGTPECMNVYTDLDGALNKRTGATKLNSVQVGAGTKDGHGLFDFEGTLIGSFGTTYYKMDEMDGTWDSLQTGMIDDMIQCEDYSGNLVVCNWGRDYAKTMQVGDTTMSSLTETHVAGRGKHPKVYKDHLLMSGVVDYPYTFFYSEVADFDDFPNGGTWPVVTHDGDKLSGWGELQGRLYAIKKWSIHQMTYLGGSPYWSRRQITFGVGTRSPKTIQNVTLPTGDEVIMFLGADRKLYQFDGYAAKPVSSNFEENNDISSISLSTINQGGMEFAHAVVDPVRHWYILFVANGGTSTITHALVFNYFTGACWPFDTQAYRSSVSALDQSDRRWTIVSDYSGYSYRWSYGNTDNGSAITAFHTTPRLLVAKDALGKFPAVVTSLKAVSDDSVSFYHREDYNETWLPSGGHSIKLGSSSGEYYLGVDTALNTWTLGAARAVVEDTYGLDTMGEYTQFKISDSLSTAPWTLYAYSFSNMALGLTKQESV